MDPVATRPDVIVAGIGLLVIPMASAGTAGDTRAESFLEEWARIGDGLSGEVTWLAEASLTAPAGTPFEFTVDWVHSTVSIVPLAIPPLELPDPDAGCLVTGPAGLGWIVEPPGVNAQGDCAQETTFDWGIARSSLICSIGPGNCAMAASGESIRFHTIGTFVLVCWSGPGVILKSWPGSPVKTADCGVCVCGGDTPNFWNKWSGAIGSFPNAGPDPGLAWGLNWQFEP